MVKNLKIVTITLFIFVIISVLGCNNFVNANSAVEEPGYIFFYIKNIPQNAKITLLIENGNSILRKEYSGNSLSDIISGGKTINASPYEGNYYRLNDTVLSFKQLEYNSKDNSAKYVLSYHYYWWIHNFKILVETDNGAIKSDTISSSQYLEKQDIGSNKEISYDKAKNIVVFDCKTGTIHTQKGFNVLWEYLFALIATIIIEVIIALIFKLKKYIKVIIITNIITQFILHVTTFILFTFILQYNLLIMILLEFIIWYLEYRIYIKYFKESGKNIILKYVITANLISFIIPLLTTNFKNIILLFID